MFLSPLCKNKEGLTVKEELKLSPESTTWYSAVLEQIMPPPTGDLRSSPGEAQNQGQ